ncbi:uncharacterized protein LOC105437156 [Strongylocentrotus purpuratus]|uniref:Uncharacterized protein n=1 Tax=Strongylocentrotus purpuratus TaxID=7668 RepID=A0A7M7SZB3_STRPU|nr:uncharacterized protein LOC105437156 [Strongylocentrotus purpuratus]
MQPYMMSDGALWIKRGAMVLCAWWLSQLIGAIDAANIPVPTTPTHQPVAGSTSSPTQGSNEPTYAPILPPTPQSSGRLGTSDYLAGFIICLTMNIAIIAIAFFFLCYLGKLSSRSGDEVDSAEPRQILSWKEALHPVAAKVFKKR